MKSNSRKLIMFFGLMFMGLSVLSSCKKEAVDLDQEKEYFGLEPGRFVEYDVTYIFHDAALQRHDTTRYQIKTLVADTVIDNSGRIVRKFYRYKRKTSSNAWEVKDLWTAVIDGDRAELVEENQRKIKLVFKPTTEKEWDINQFNNLGEMRAKYSGINESKTINGLSFASTVTVMEENYETKIDSRVKYEVYAKNVGMVSKYYKDLMFQFSAPTVPIKGEEYYYNVVNYGVQ